jgi:hypothetical protein
LQRRLEHGELKVKHSHPTDIDLVNEAVVYKYSTHQHSTTFVATEETHTCVQLILELYIFSDSNDMHDLKAHTSNAICTEFPVYEAELVKMLTTLLDYTTNDLSRLDSTLARFISERMFFLHEALVSNKEVLPLLRTVISAKDQAEALLGKFKELEILGKQVQSAPLDTQSTPTTKRKHAQAFEEEVQPNTSKLGGECSTPEDSAHGTVADNELGNVNSSDRPMVRRPRAGKIRDRSGVILVRPKTAGQWYSILVDRWNEIDENTDKGRSLKIAYTHAGHICETEAGKLAEKPCSECLKGGHQCEVYVDGRNGGACARCRLTAQQAVNEGRKAHSCTHATGARSREAGKKRKESMH